MTQVIRLTTFENGNFRPFQDISQEYFDELRYSSDIIKSSYTQFVVFKYLQMNLNDYGKFLSQITNVPLASISLNIFTDINFVLEVNKYVLNILVSFKFFLDNAETYLKRKYGREADNVLEFKKLLSKHYDENFAYRFLSRLRNYCVHLGFPLTGVAFDVTTPPFQAAHQKGDFKLEVDIELLKKEKDLFGNMHNEICKYENDIDLIPLIHSLSKSILDIQKYIYRIQKEEIFECFEKLASLEAHKTDTNQINVFYGITRNGNAVSFNTYEIPIDIVAELRMVYSDWQ